MQLFDKIKLIKRIPFLHQTIYPTFKKEIVLFLKINNCFNFNIKCIYKKDIIIIIIRFWERQ